MDTNLVGKPTEGYGFSNNITGKFGPPPFKKWLFEISGNKKIVLKPTCSFFLKLKSIIWNSKDGMENANLASKYGTKQIISSLSSYFEILIRLREDDRKKIGSYYRSRNRGYCNCNLPGKE